MSHTCKNFPPHLKAVQVDWLSQVLPCSAFWLLHGPCWLTCLWSTFCYTEWSYSLKTEVKRSLTQTSAAKGQICEETHLAMNIWADSADCVYTDHQIEQYDKYCSFIVSSNRRMPSAWSWLGYSLQDVISIIKEIISSHSEIIVSYSETYILTFNTHVPASLL